MKLTQYPQKALPSYHCYPLYQSPAACGFPNPAADYMDEQLSLDQLLVRRPAATFFARAQGCSMEGAGIKDNAILVIDRSLRPNQGDIILAQLNGDLLVKRLDYQGEQPRLLSEHPDYPALLLDTEEELNVWGVIVAAINPFR